MSEVYGISGGDESALMENQRFEKLCRLPQLGVYVDEAHHLFGADIESQILPEVVYAYGLKESIQSGYLKDAEPEEYENLKNAEFLAELEKILSELGIPSSKILVNIGDNKYTRNEDIRNFNDLDVKDSDGNEKQFINNGYVTFSG